MNLPRLLERAETACRVPAGCPPPADSQVLARRAGRLSSFVRLSLDEPAVLGRMQRAARELGDCPRLDALLPRVLDAALELTSADFGNVQLLDPASGVLTIVTQSGFGPEFTGYFAAVDDDHSACGRAARAGAQVVIADVTTDPGFAPYRGIAAAAGFRAVQSTPLSDAGGRLVGMVSTHFRRPGPPAGRGLRILELYADLAGEAIARHLGLVSVIPAQRLAGSEEDDPPPPSPVRLAQQAALAGFADEVVRRLFAAGLSLASAQSIVGNGAAGDRVAAAVDELDGAIRDIRTAVFARCGP